MRHQVAGTLQSQLDEVRQSDVESETFAYQSRDLGLMLEHVRRRDHAADAVAEHVHGHAGVFRSGYVGQLVHILQPVRKLLDVISPAFRFASAAEVKSVSGKTGARELL